MPAADRAHARRRSDHLSRGRRDPIPPGVSSARVPSPLVRFAEVPALAPGVAGPAGPSIQRAAVGGASTYAAAPTRATLRGGRLHRARPAAGPAPIQRARLMKQTGPSCWLFVLEGLALDAGLSTRWLATAMQAYPSSEDADTELKAMKQDKDTDFSHADRRLAALRLMAKRLGAFVTILGNYRDKGGQDAGAHPAITLARARKFAGRAQVDGALTQYLAHATVDPQNLGTAAMITDFRKAEQRAKTLFDTVNAAKGQGDEVQALLGGEGVEISKDAKISDIDSTLQHAIKLPAYGSIRARFTLRDTDDRGQNQDFTKRPIKEMSPTTHAVLVTHYDPNGKIVTYKDPNYGDIGIKVRIGQFRAMAGTSRIVLRTIVKGGLRPSKINEVKD